MNPVSKRRIRRWRQTAPLFIFISATASGNCEWGRGSRAGDYELYARFRIIPAFGEARLWRRSVHIINFMAYDAAGNMAVSSYLTITVQAPPPS